MLIKKEDGSIIELSETVININQLQLEKEKLENQIANSPQLKEKPDEQTLELWNKTVLNVQESILSSQIRVSEIDRLVGIADKATPVSIELKPIELKPVEEPLEEPLEKPIP